MTIRAWRRGLLFAALCLLLGAVTTVGVAWYHYLSFGNNYELGNSDVEVCGGGQRWAVSRTWYAGVEHVRITYAPSNQPPGHSRRRVDRVLRDTVAMLPVDDFRETPLFRSLTYSAALHAPPPTSPGSTTLWASGYPACALAMTRHDGAGPATHSGAIATPWGRAPATILWPSFFVDTVVYASAYGLIWYGVLTSPGAVRRWRTRNAGKCRKCGYDLRSLVAGEAGVICPECGRKVMP